MVEMLHDYVKYNVWANDIIVNYLEAQPTGTIDKNVINSFPSIRATLLHNIGAEAIWLSRLKSQSPNRFPGENFDGDDQALFKFLLETSESFRDLVLSKDENYFNEYVSFKTLNGTHYNQKRSRMIHHCMNHSTYHRGQIITMSKQLGLSQAPSTDLIFYYRERRKLV